jgi:sulfite reductase (NADPH) hemoprotein beta-component
MPPPAGHSTSGNCQACTHTIRSTAQRVAQYRDQLRRFQAGTLSEDEFRPLRLQNGLYIQKHAPMLRVAIPYGLLSSAQLRKLATSRAKYDRGYGHFSTRQNIQYNWPKLEDTGHPRRARHRRDARHPDQRQLRPQHHLRQFAGVAPDEIVDPRPYCEILRQWSTFHPEFAFLPRKFKIAVNGAPRTAPRRALHDIGLHLRCDADGEPASRARRRRAGPHAHHRPCHPRRPAVAAPADLLEAILRVYNRHGRRDNMYKARIKILVKALGPDEFARQVEEEWAHLEGRPAR